jgi:outer membrane receptor for ferrienterochelin and colicins
MKKFFHLTVVMLLVFHAEAQHIYTGSVYHGKTKEPLKGVVLQYNNNQFALSDHQGQFKINTSDESITVYLSHIGFQSDSIVFHVDTPKKTILLQPNAISIQKVEIYRKGKATEINRMDARNVQTLTTRELQKAACCNLSESFETSASVDVSFSDALTGARRMKMLGLDGRYIQLLTENTSEFRGLGQAFGIQYVPGHWMESIQILKGAGSVTQGYEAFTGQMNIELLKPQLADKFSLSMYQSAQGRTELTAHVAQKLNRGWSALLAAHTQQEYGRWDMNKDGFLDQPLVRNGHVYNRWHWQGKRAESQIGIKYLREFRHAGQAPLPKDAQPLVAPYYLQHQTDRIFAWAKLGILFPRKPYKSIGNIFSVGLHQQASSIGFNEYKGKEKSLQYTFLYQTIWRDTRHQIKMGSSFLLDGFQEKYQDSSWNRVEQVPGIFAEWHEKPNNIPIDLIIGARLDHHNLYGLFATPRANLKWNVNENNILKFSYGTGFRTINALAENIGLFASNRTWEVLEKPLAERSYIFGGSYIRNMVGWNREWTLTIDYYETHFTNQWVVDVEESGKILMYNQKSPSMAQSFQVEINGEINEQTTLRLAYKYDNPKTGYQNGSQIRPLVEQQRGLANVAWESINEKWLVDVTSTYTGKKRIPNYYHLVQTVNGYSPGFFLVNAQITKRFKNADWYLGAENIFNFRQLHPVIGNYLGPGFDASMVWGPIMGRNIYLGLRLKMK